MSNLSGWRHGRREALVRSILPSSAPIWLGAILMATPSPAAVFEVSSQASINAAIAAARPGDTIRVANGVYTFPVRINGANGTTENPITFEAESVGGVLFTGDQLGDRVKLRVERDHWVIDGFRFDNIKTSGDSSTDRVTVIRLRGASDNVLRNLSISNSGLTSASPHTNAANNSMFLDITDSSARNTIERSEFLNNEGIIVVRVAGGSTDINSTDNVFRYNYWTGHSGFETLQLSWGSSSNVAFRTTVEHNLWKDNATSSELISSKSSENVFRHNTFDHNNDQLVLRSGDGSTVDSNYFLNGRGVRAYGADHTITNNYFEGYFGPETGNLKGGILIGAGDSDDAPYAPFRESLIGNNTIVNTGDFSLLYGQFFNSTWNGDRLDVTPYENDFTANLIVNSEGQAIFRENNAPDNSNAWAGNYTWSSGSGSPGYAPNGVNTNLDPELERDALGNLVSTRLEGVGAQMRYRPLTVDDVGPGSTFVAGLAGDYDQNGFVDHSDFAVWKQLYGSRELTADGDFDGKVTAADYAIWREALALSSAAQQGGPALIPEPSAAATAVIALLLFPYRHG